MTGLTPIRRLCHIVLAGVLLSAVITLLGGSVAGAQTDDIDSAAVYHYRIDADTGQLQVTAEFAITADKPNRSTNRGVTQYYFTGYYFTVPQEINDLSITQDGVELEFEVLDEDEFGQVLDVSFRRNIFYGRTANVDISYTVDGSIPRGEALTRINGAYAGFAIWGDPTIETSEFNVYLPDGFTASDVSSYRFEAETIDGEAVLQDSTTSGEADFYFELLSLRNDDALVRSELEVDGHSVEIQAWPGDDAWLEFATETVEEGMPVLIDLVGVEWPVEDTLTIAESYSPYLVGYAGWYSADTNVIEVGDELDTHTLLHEMSHAWFNQDLFRERWITEGLADTYAARAAELISDSEPDGETVGPESSQFDSAARPLSGWSRIYNGDSNETESWSYGAAWTVTEEIIDQIGYEAMGEVLTATKDDVISYQGENDPEAAQTVRSWRSYLDLLEVVGGAEDLEEVFADWVMTPAQQIRLDRRSETRPSYEALEERGESWAVPLVVRHEMDKWDFNDVDELIVAAEAVLDVRDETLAVADGFGLAIPADAEESYQDADTDLDQALLAAQETRDATQILVAGIERIDTDRSLTTRVGLIGTDPELLIDEAIEAFEDHDFELAAEKVAEVETMIAQAGNTGTTRLGLAAGGLFLVIVGFGLVRRRRNKAGRPSSPDASDELDQDDLSPEAGDTDWTGEDDDQSESLLEAQDDDWIEKEALVGG